MAATKYDIVIEKRACFNLPITLTDDADLPIDLDDLTGDITLTGQIRRSFDNVLQTEFSFEPTVTSGMAYIVLSSGQTAGLDIAPSYYDIFLDGRTTNCSEKILYGNVTISGNVTV